MELSERNCHRLKAVLREVTVKCIRELIRRKLIRIWMISRIRITHVTCTEWRMLIISISIRVEPRSMTSSLSIKETKSFCFHGNSHLHAHKISSSSKMKPPVDGRSVQKNDIV